MARKKTVKITEDKIEIQGGDVEIAAPVIEDCHIEVAEGVIVPSLRDLAVTIEKSIEDSVNLNEEVMIPLMERVEEKQTTSFTATAEVVAESSFTMDTRAHLDVKKIVEYLQPLTVSIDKETLREAIEEAIKDLPKAKPLMQDLNEVAVQLAQEAKTVHHERRSIYLRQQGELETILLPLGNLKHKLSLLAPDVAEFPVISHIKADIFGEG